MLTMKAFSVLIFLFVVALGSLSVFYFTNRDINPMIGTWEMRSGVYYGPDGNTGFSADNTRQMKVINKTHFTTLWQDTVYNKNRGFNGGSYTFENGIYTEYLEYFVIEDRIGDTAHFKVELEDNTLSISACDKDGNISKTGYFQVWERVK